MGNRYRNEATGKFFLNKGRHWQSIPNIQDSLLLDFLSNSIWMGFFVLEILQGDSSERLRAKIISRGTWRELWYEQANKPLKFSFSIARKTHRNSLSSHET